MTDHLKTIRDALELWVDSAASKEELCDAIEAKSALSQLQKEREELVGLLSQYSYQGKFETSLSDEDLRSQSRDLLEKLRGGE